MQKNNSFARYMLFSAETDLRKKALKRNSDITPFFIFTEDEAKVHLGLSEKEFLTVTAKGLLKPYFISGDKKRYLSNNLMMLERISSKEASDILGLEEEQKFNDLIKRKSLPYKTYSYTGEPYFHIKDILELKQKLQ